MRIKTLVHTLAVVRPGLHRLRPCLRYVAHADARSQLLVRWGAATTSATARAVALFDVAMLCDAQARLLPVAFGAVADVEAGVRDHFREGLLFRLVALTDDYQMLTEVDGCRVLIADALDAYLAGVWFVRSDEDRALVATVRPYLFEIATLNPQRHIPARADRLAELFEDLAVELAQVTDGMATLDGAGTLAQLVTAGSAMTPS